MQPIRLGVAGLGRAFSLMLDTLVMDERVRLVAACDPREPARRQFMQDFGAPGYASIEELADDESVEAIYIATPHRFHAAHTRAAASRGKHVLVEKPMALSPEDCDAMIEACAAMSVHLIVGHCHSFDSPYRQARRIIDGGELGRVRMMLALNYTDFLFRPRNPEELSTGLGGGVVFSQAAHQVDVVRLLAGNSARRVRAFVGSWDPARPTEGAYSALLWFDGDIVASLTYSGYAHFDSDEWVGGIGEMGTPKDPEHYGAARRRLKSIHSSSEEAQLKAAGTYGGPAYGRTARHGMAQASPWHQHFGPVIVSCERGDVRPMPDGVWIYGDDRREHRPLPAPAVPRFEVIDELYFAVREGRLPVHDGRWGSATLEICHALLQSARDGRDVELRHQRSSIDVTRDA